MKVVLFTDTYPPFINGVSTSVFNLCKVLKDHGNEVLVVTTRFDDGELELVDGVLRVPGVEMKNLYGYRLTNVFSSAAFKIISDFDPDIAHVHTDSTISIFSRIVARRLNIPVIYTYHTSLEDYTYYVTKGGIFDRPAKKIIRTYSNVIANAATGFITPSDKFKEFMRAVGNDIYINVVPTGIEFDLFKDDKVDKNAIASFKKEHGIDKDTLTFLLLGRIAKEKAMDVSIKCLARYKEKHPDKKLKLIVVGNGPQKEEYEQLVKTEGIDDITDFIGAVPASEVPFYYHVADIFTSASITETQGLTFMEAMASKNIVIARYDDNLANTIINGKTGFFFTDENNFVDVIDKVLSMSNEEIEQIKKQALDVIEIYSMERFYKNIEEVYKRAIRKYW